MEETKREAAQVVELLDLRQGGLTQTLDGGFPELRNSVWQSEVSVQAAVQVRMLPPAPAAGAVCSSHEGTTAKPWHCNLTGPTMARCTDELARIMVRLLAQRPKQCRSAKG